MVLMSLHRCGRGPEFVLLRHMKILSATLGDIRICLDPKDLNRAIKREYSQMPTAVEIMSQMSGAKIFS